MESVTKGTTIHGATIFEDYSSISDQGLRQLAVNQIAGAAIKPGQAIAEKQTSGLINIIPAALKDAHPIFFYHEKESIKKGLSTALHDFLRDKKVSEIQPIGNNSQHKPICVGNYQLSQSFEITINGRLHRIDVLDFETNSNVTYFDHNAIRRPFGGSWIRRHEADDLFPTDDRQIIMLDLFEYGITQGKTVGKVFDKSAYTAITKPSNVRSRPGHELHPVVVISPVDK